MPPNEKTAEEKAAIGTKLPGAYIYWANFRILFNILVGGTGFACIGYFAGFRVMGPEILGMIAWGIVANGLYSLGYALDSFMIVRSKGKNSLAPYRAFLFWTGTIAYMLVSVVFSANYFLLSPD